MAARYVSRDRCFSTDRGPTKGRLAQTTHPADDMLAGEPAPVGWTGKLPQVMRIAQSVTVRSGGC